jgi:hypothetical protein
LNNRLEKIILIILAQLPKNHNSSTKEMSIFVVEMITRKNIQKSQFFFQKIAFFVLGRRKELFSNILAQTLKIKK